MHKYQLQLQIIKFNYIWNPFLTHVNNGLELLGLPTPGSGAVHFPANGGCGSVDRVGRPITNNRKVADLISTLGTQKDW